VTVFVKNEWLKPDNANEIVRLREWENKLITDITNLEAVIADNSRYRNNTNVQSERDKRHEFNEALRGQLAYNQSKLKVVQECLVGL
ncbi:MAG: hypothetical protein LBG52_07475, partial [Candidatus Peribacteria bacterium]|nr:hypothetical protein [Candidatus Peribacteria bacterium]